MISVLEISLIWEKEVSHISEENMGRKILINPISNERLSQCVLVGTYQNKRALPAKYSQSSNFLSPRYTISIRFKLNWFLSLRNPKNDRQANEAKHTYTHFFGQKNFPTNWNVMEKLKKNKKPNFRTCCIWLNEVFKMSEGGQTVNMTNMERGHRWM